MMLDKAKKTLQEILDGTQPTSIIDRRLAIKLGIEALKAWERIRIGATSQHLWKLPGETKD